MLKIINWNLVDSNELNEITKKCLNFNAICEDCHCNIQLFHSKIISYGIEEKWFNSDFQIKRFVWNIIDMPFEYDNMSDSQIKFLRAIHKRYFTIPLRYKIKDYLKEQKQVKYN